MYVVKIPRSNYYQVVYFVNGKRTTHSTKKTNEKEALKYLEEFSKGILSDKKNIVNPLGVVSSLPQNSFSKNTLILSAFRDEYLDYVRPVKSKKYFDSIEFSFKQFISFCDDIPLVEIDTRMVDKFVYSTFHRTQRGAHHYYRTLKAAFNKAIAWDYITVNPFTKVKFPKMSKSFPAFISEEELLIILTNTPYQYLKDIFIVGFYTGLRLGELINLQWNWIDFFHNQITVKCTANFQTKSKKERIVPMNEKVKSILIKRLNLSSHQPNDNIFYRIVGRRLHQETISKQFKEAVRKSNLNEKIHFHSLRHSFASVLVQKGVSLYVVKELLGHESLTTTQVYSHLQQQNLRDAVNLL